MKIFQYGILLAELENETNKIEPCSPCALSAKK